ncbi:alpha-1,3-mannosyltransferase [Roseibium hamelinense]|uniref:Alpha-1,3-mannosyltransferase n=1 Tax=Roseibium hamelinense TaxID=150831 RepID=A0A562T2N9_9HYPH|nr:glycosyltransferase family 4 protein [Roseibium hamelinense]MTI43839.1 glycosyltransferase family 1 protein [Roseibium hamelinense]TWI87076.1 alpha-1,3-mannosyltransferase [Roseibium hamelinense]
MNGSEDASGFEAIKIVHVVRQYLPRIGGLEDVVKNLVRLQNERFNSVEVVTLDRLFTDLDVVLAQEQVFEGTKVYRIPFHGSPRYPIAPSVLGFIKQADLVHVHAVDFFFDFLPLTKWLHGKPLVATTHGGFFHTQKNSFLKKIWFNTMTRVTANGFRGLACCSNSDLAQFKAIAPDRVRLIENGVDLDKFRGAASKKAKKRLVAIGRFSANKRLDRLLDTVKALIEMDPNWRLLIAGVPSDLSAADVQALIAYRGLEDSVSLKIGLSEAEIAKELAECSMFVSASEYEGFGLSLIEALSAGLTAVVHPNTAFQSLSAQHPTVQLTDFSNAASAATSIEELWRDLSADPAESRERAIASAQQHGWAETVKHYDHLYREALNLP